MKHINFLKLGWPPALLGLLVAATIQSAVHGEDSPLSTNSTSVVRSPISIDDLITQILEKNPEINYYRAEIDAAQGLRRTAATMSNLEISGEYGEKRVRAEPSIKGPAWSASISQTFEFPGRVTLRKAIANKQIELAQLGFDE